jgi:hypothetical protein
VYFTVPLPPVPVVETILIQFTLLLAFHEQPEVTFTMYVPPLQFTVLDGGEMEEVHEGVWPCWVRVKVLLAIVRVAWRLEFSVFAETEYFTVPEPLLPEAPEVIVIQEELLLVTAAVQGQPVLGEAVTFIESVPAALVTVWEAGIE